MMKEEVASEKHSYWFLAHKWRGWEAIPGLKKSKEMAGPLEKQPVEQQKRNNVLSLEQILKLNKFLRRRNT
jgi:hypothetical protein